MSTDAERLAALLHVYAIGCAPYPHVHTEDARDLTEAGVGFPAAPDEGLDTAKLARAEGYAAGLAAAREAVAKQPLDRGDALWGTVSRNAALRAIDALSDPRSEEQG